MGVSHCPTCTRVSGDSTMWGKYHLLLLCLALVSPLALTDGDEEDELSRDPYQYQVKVDDVKTANRYEIAESGSPEVVEGSYRIALPDGRVQIVTYQVHSDKGFDAKVTYEGTAQYPDTPDYVPSAYGPPEPIRPGYAKFKRQSQQKYTRKKIGRKVEKEEKIKKTFKPKENTDISPDLLTASSQNDYFKKEQTKQNEKRQIKPKKVLKDNFDDSEHSPQAEPLSLRQQSTPVNTKRPREYKPPLAKQNIREEITIKEEPTDRNSEPERVATPLVIHEAVPTSTDSPTVFHINYVAGHDDHHFASPGEAFDDLTDSVFSETIHNQAIRNLERSEAAQVPSSYHSAPDDHETIQVTQPVATLQEFAEPVVINDVKPEHVHTQHSFQETIPTIDPNRPNYPRVRFHDLSEDPKNHKKRKIDNNDYFRTEKKTNEQDNENNKNVNILPTVYRSQIKWKPTNNEEKKQSDKKNEKESKASVENVVIPEKQEQKLNIQSDETAPLKISTEVKSLINNSKESVHKDELTFKIVEKPKVIVSSLPDLYQDLYQTIFEAPPPVTTRRPKYKIIRKARVPKQFTYQPVHRSQSLRLVQRNDGFVPAYVPRY